MSAGEGGQPLEVWRGAVNPWRCDEMGHMNMRYYLAIAEEGLASLAHALGQPRAFTRGAASTLQVRAQHVRFLREAHAGDTLYATGGVLELGEQSVRLLQVIRHAGGAASAAVVTDAVHATPEGRAFAWSPRAREAAAALVCPLPEEAGPRGLASLDDQAPSLARAEALGLTCIARGAVAEGECDAFGQMTGSAILGRVSDGMALLSEPVRRAVGQAHPQARVGGAALEYALSVRRAPRAGDLLEVRSGFARLEARTTQIRHWLLDPSSGEPYAVLAGVGGAFDLDARKMLALPQALRDAAATPGLS